MPVLDEDANAYKADTGEPSQKAADQSEPTSESFCKREATPPEIARSYRGRSWKPIPIPTGSKGPKGNDWPTRTFRDSGFTANIGVQLGAASNGLTDVDLDCPEAVRLAPYFLPQTGAIFGRAGKPNSHWLYYTALADTQQKGVLPFMDGEPVMRPDGKPFYPMLVELRHGGGGKGTQTVFPGSVHKNTGELIEWSLDGEPARVDGERLKRDVTHLAVATLLLKGWAKGKSRHDSALHTAGFLARAGLTQDEVVRIIKAVSWENGDDPDKVKDQVRTAEDAFEHHQNGNDTPGLPKLIETLQSEKRASRISDWLAYRERGEESPDALDLLTEDTAALEFRSRYNTTLRYCHSTGIWFEWDGFAWREDRTKRAFHYARELVRDLARTAPRRVKSIASKVAFAAGVERYCQADPGFAVTQAEWDGDPFLLGTPEGTVDLRTGKLRAADPRDGITKLTAVGPAEAASCPRFIEFLQEATGNDPALSRFIQQWSGLCLTGCTREQQLVFLYGPGKNGKTVLLNVLTGILNDYAKVAAIETFTASKTDRHPTEIAALRGARLVSVSETEENRSWAESRIKQLTGGDPVTARFMRQDEFTYVPQFKLTIIGNHKPNLQNVDEAMKRRFNIVPFTITPSNPDRLLSEKLKKEWPGILRWMIDGCLDWQQNGLVRPASIIEATDDYFDCQDHVAEWLEERCKVDRANPDRQTPTAWLYASYRDYMESINEFPKRMQWFSEELKRRGFTYNPNTPVGQGSYKRGFRGISLRRPGIWIGR